MLCVHACVCMCVHLPMCVCVRVRACVHALMRVAKSTSFLLQTYSFRFSPTSNSLGLSIVRVTSDDSKFPVDSDLPAPGHGRAAIVPMHRARLSSSGIGHDANSSRPTSEVEVHPYSVKRVDLVLPSEPARPQYKSAKLLFRASGSTHLFAGILITALEGMMLEGTLTITLLQNYSYKSSQPKHCI